MKKVVCLILVGLLFLTGCEVKKVSDVTDQEKFAIEYSIDKENPYHYSNIDEVLTIFTEGTGIVLFANPDCEKSNASVEILTKALNDRKIKKVYYYNPKKIQDENSKKYKQLIGLIEKHLETDEDENPYLFLPDLYFVRDGKIIGHDNEMATITLDKEHYLTNVQKKQLRNNYQKLIKKYKILECTTC